MREIPIKNYLILGMILICSAVIFICFMMLFKNNDNNSDLIVHASMNLK